jgi:aminocarboxymuconate-semialdehyde decarboxylase
MAHKTVDVHTHFLPPECIEDATNSTYVVRIRESQTRDVLLRREMDAPGYEPAQLYDLERRRQDIARMRVDLQVLSVPPPIGFFYDQEPELAARLCRVVNDGFARAAATDPAQFVALATVPLQDPAEAVRELDRVSGLGLRGVEIGTNIAGRDLDDAEFRPFFQTAQALGVPIFIHSTNAVALGNGKRMRRYHLSNLIGNPTEDALAAASLVFGGVLEELPGLKVYLAHGGGSCPFLRGRWERGWHVRPEAKTCIQRPPSDYFGLLRFDSLTHAEAALGYLVASAGADRVMLGTDYPYDMGEPDPVSRIGMLRDVSDADRRLVLGGNAAALFGLDGD